MNAPGLPARFTAALTTLCDRIEPLLPSDAVLAHWSLIAWLLCLLCLSPALLRIVMRRSRNLDPIWAIVAMLVLNRLSFLLRISPQVSHASAIVLSLAMAIATTWYQRWDKSASI